jgi:eukaryotic-like serine/threonine-protein kinase
MASLLAERSRTGPLSPAARAEETDSGWLRRLRDRRPDQASDHPGPPSGDGGATRAAVNSQPVRLSPNTLPPVPPVRPVTETAVAPGALGGDTIAAGSVAPAVGAYATPPPSGTQDRYDDESFGVLADDDYDAYDDGGYDDAYDGPVTGENDLDEDGARRHRLVVVGLPLLALLIVIALAWWIGDKVLSVAGDVDEVPGSTPSASAPAEQTGAGPVAAGEAVPIASGDVFDPQGDGDPDNPGDVALAFDGDPSTSWSTYEYRGSPAFGNLKDGVGLLLDLGSAQDLAAVTLTSDSAGATVEIRTGDSPDGDVDSFTVAQDGTIDGETELAFDEAVSARYVLVWITGLVDSENGFSADIAEVTVQAAG